MPSMPYTSESLPSKTVTCFSKITIKMHLALKSLPYKINEKTQVLIEGSLFEMANNTQSTSHQLIAFKLIRQM